MDNNNRIQLSSILSIALLCIACLTLTPFQKVNADNLPLSDEKEYTENVNQWLLEKKQAHDITRKTKTPEKIAKEAAFWSRLLSHTGGAVKSISFYARIVDQYGDAVPGVQVKYKAISRYLAAGTGFGQTTTDDEGRFDTNGAKGTGLSIRKFLKPGYQFSGKQNFANFKRFENSILWKGFTKKTPYVFKAWKVERYPKVNVGSTPFRFDLGILYSMDFTAQSVKRVKHKGDLDLDLQVIIDRDDSGWKVKLLVPNGGLIETKDQFLNLAPENGYKKDVDYSGVKKRYADVVIKKKYYIHSRDRMYGSLIVEIRPYYSDTSAIKFQYVMNLENGRNLAVRRK